jgi:spore cortex biosynthesis protein YabQ
MIISVNNQVLILIASVYGGMLIGLLFDFFRLLRKGFKIKKAVIPVGDIIFWAASVVIILAVVYNSSSGLIRSYQLIGLALGTFIYLKLLSKYVLTILPMILIGIRTLFYAIIAILKVPVVLAANILWKPCKRFRKAAINAAHNAAGFAAKHIGILIKKK